METTMGHGVGDASTADDGGADLEVVGDADDGVVDVVVNVGAEVVVLITEGRRLHHDAAILGADVEAGADLVRDAGAVDGADIRVAAKAEGVGLRIVNRVKEDAGDSGFEERIQVPVIEAVDVRAGDFLKAVVDVVIAAGKSEVLDVLVVLEVDFQRAVRREVVAIAHEGSVTNGGMELDGVTGGEGRNNA